MVPVPAFLFSLLNFVFRVVRVFRGFAPEAGHFVRFVILSKESFNS
jgi:hypothetical protein